MWIWNNNNLENKTNIYSRSKHSMFKIYYHLIAFIRSWVLVFVKSLSCTIIGQWYWNYLPGHFAKYMNVLGYSLGWDCEWNALSLKYWYRNEWQYLVCISQAFRRCHLSIKLRHVFTALLIFISFSIFISPLSLWILFLFYGCFGYYSLPTIFHVISLLLRVHFMLARLLVCIAPYNGYVLCA